MTIKIIESRPDSEEAKGLIAELSEVLQKITGDDGTSSFSNEEFDHLKSSFLVLQDDGKSVACGSIRPLGEDACEIKRMYCRKTGKGLGKQMLQALEIKAVNLGFNEIRLSTRKINSTAVEFYKANNYAICEAYGKYLHQPESICLSKLLTN